MKAKYSLITLLAVITLLTAACKKYVEVKPKGVITPTKISDYQLLLNNTTIWNKSFSTVDYATDDCQETDPALIKAQASKAIGFIYQWSDYFYQTSEDDPEWNNFYKQVYTANVILDGMSKFSAEEISQNKTINASARVHRAYAYLCLVNLYAKGYDANASANPGVPLLLTPSYTQSLKRATVAAVYQQILQDFNEALPDLPGLPSDKASPSQAAVYALLARTYLYMGDYARALANATQCLSLQSTLQNLNNYSSAGPLPGFSLPLGKANPEVIFLKASLDQELFLQLSPDMSALYGTRDLRYVFFTYNGPDAGDYIGRYYAYFAPFEPRNEGPTVGEVMLIQAECLARTQHGQDGLTVINNLRKVRFKPADYTALTATTDDQALTLILQERRRELFGRGFRLFDLKRLNPDPRFTVTITHPYNGQTLTLAPASPRYVYPIPQKVVSANPEIEQNPRN